MENHLQQIMLGVKSAVVMCGKQMSVSTYNLACSCYSTAQYLVVLIYHQWIEVELCEVEFRIYRSKNCLCNIVEFQINASEIHYKLKLYQII